LPIDEVASRGFGAGATAYEAARPGYPPAALDVLVSEASIGPGRTVLDLGAGTGKLTRLLAATGADLIAVEPVEAMREQLVGILPDVELRDGSGEEIPAPDSSVDVVTVAQAFHWFDAPAALAEIARVLRPGGTLAILWNERDESTPWVAEMSRIIHWHERTVSRYQHVDWAAIVASAGRFTPLQERTVAWDQPMTCDLLADRVRSISYIAAMPASARERLVNEVVYLVRRLPEPFDLPYSCRVQWAQLT